MNYIKEINAFYDRQEQSELSGSAVALWYALMHINNKTRWKNEFTASGKVLRFKAGLTESSFKRARAELKGKGYIDYKSRTGGRAPIYRMFSLVMDVEGEYAEFVAIDGQVSHGEGEIRQHGSIHLAEEGNQTMEKGLAYGIKPNREQCLEWGRYQVIVPEVKDDSIQSMPQEVTRAIDHQGADKCLDRDVNHNVDYQPTQSKDRDMELDVTGEMNHVPDRVVAPLYKQYINNNKTIRNNTNASAEDNRQGGNSAEQKSLPSGSDAIVFYQDNFGLVSPFVAESLMDWVNDLGEELVIEGMKRALEQNKTSWGYVKSILNSWYKKGIRTLEQVEAEKVEYRNNKQEKRRAGNSSQFGGIAGKEEIVPKWFKEQKQRERKKREKEKGDQGKLETVDLEAQKIELQELLGRKVR